eukprot:COSAG04_NODE_25970_length_301_cov_0.762376_1_plen_40_part_01
MRLFEIASGRAPEVAVRLALCTTEANAEHNVSVYEYEYEQ